MRGVYPKTLKPMRLPVGISGVLIAVGFGIGLALAQVFVFPVETLNFENLQSGISAEIEEREHQANQWIR